jgi:hypothetical protein
MYREVIRQLNNYCAGNYNRCKGQRVDASEFCYTIDELVTNMNDFFSSFPIIDVHLGDMMIQWNPVEYLVNEASNPDKFCLGVESQV